MKANRVSSAAILAVVLCAVAGLRTQGAQAQAYSISATPVNGASGATEQVQYTVSNIPIAGTLTVNCQYSGSSTFQEQAKLPVCGVGPLVGFTVSAGQTLSGTIGLTPWGAPLPASFKGRRGKRSAEGAAGWMLAGALLLGLGLRRRTRRWQTLAGMAAAGLLISFGVSACGGSSNGPMPGVYVYTVTANVEPNPMTPLGQGVTTNVNVTVK
jgi:hypothetical protein